jgi:hypothetical protein
MLYLGLRRHSSLELGGLHILEEEVSKTKGLLDRIWYRRNISTLTPCVEPVYF